MIINILNRNKYFLSFLLFIICLIIGIIFLYFERKIIGISSEFHPDSKWYLNRDVLTAHSYLSFKFGFFENIYNLIINFHYGNLYYSLVNLFIELKKFDIININNGYRNLILLNIFVYSITNALIFFYYLKYFHAKQNNLLFFISLVIFFILPYKLHLSVHILKESLIFLILVYYVLNPSKISFIITLFFGTSFRFGFVLYYLTLFEIKNFIKLKKFYLFLVVFTLILGVFYFKFVENDSIVQTFIVLVEERNFNVMAGRDFDNIPNFSDNEIGFLYRSLIWPIFFLSGTFIFFTENFYFKLMGLEIIFMQVIMYLCHKKIIFNIGIIVFLIILSLWVTTFTAFYRYAYLAFLALFLKSIFEIKNRNKI